ncbi:MAG: hypothetical protein CR984_05235 [Proteobacteria bacterium]|nr:MAG: hypothetical protein CR984_05235 [Pseudomonadota bacterium]
MADILLLLHEPAFDGGQPILKLNRYSFVLFSPMQTIQFEIRMLYFVFHMVLLRLWFGLDSRFWVLINE